MFEAIILGLIQGLTEFLPVSSTGHLILGRSLLGLSDDYALVFDAVLHLATAMAVVVCFRSDIWSLIQIIFRKLGRLPVDKKDLNLVYALIVGTIPAVFFGLLLEDVMATNFRSPFLVAAVLVLGSIFFIYAESAYTRRRHRNRFTVKAGLKIGLWQSLALIPGFSRAGATISGGMILGFSRGQATKFAFLLAIPIMLGAGSKKLIEIMATDTAIAWLPLLVSATTAFFVGCLAIKFMLKFVRRHTFWPFIWYRIILAGLVILIGYLI